MIVKLYEENPSERIVKQVVDCLKSGGLVVYPTDTLYGLGCDIFNKRAMERLYRYKGVKAKKANFSFICYDLSHISEYAAQLDTPTYKLMKSCLPGPFTFILKASKQIPTLFKNNKKTVGIRVPDNNIARMMVKELGYPIVSTSIFQKDDVLGYYTDPEEIHDELGHLVDIVVDGGIGGLEASTVVDCTGYEPEILRQGKGEL